MASSHTDAGLEVWESFIRANSVISEALSRELQETRGLPLPWYEVLLYLSRSKDARLRLQELADRVLYSRSGLTRLIDRMAAAGLVRREPCLDDRRGTFAVLTPEGRRAFRRAAPTHVRGIERHFLGRLSADDLSALRGVLVRLVTPGPGAP